MRVSSLRPARLPLAHAAALKNVAQVVQLHHVLLAGRSRRAGRAKAPCLPAAAAHWAVHNFCVLEILDEQTFLCASAKHSFETKLLSCNYELFWDIFDVNRFPQSFIEDVLLL